MKLLINTEGMYLEITEFDKQKLVKSSTSTPHTARQVLELMIEHWNDQFNHDANNAVTVLNLRQEEKDHELHS